MTTNDALLFRAMRLQRAWRHVFNGDRSNMPSAHWDEISEHSRQAWLALAEMVEKEINVTVGLRMSLKKGPKLK